MDRYIRLSIVVILILAGVLQARAGTRRMVLVTFGLIFLYWLALTGTETRLLE
jgi:hypothetical protein